MPHGAGSQWATPEGLTFVQSTLTRIVPQYPSGPYAHQTTVTANFLNGKNQLLFAGCGDGKTGTTYLHLLLVRELARDPSLPRFGSTFVTSPIVLMATPLTDLGRSQVCYDFISE